MAGRSVSSGRFVFSSRPVSSEVASRVAKVVSKNASEVVSKALSKVVSMPVSGILAAMAAILWVEPLQNSSRSLKDVLI